MPVSKNHCHRITDPTDRHAAISAPVLTTIMVACLAASFLLGRFMSQQPANSEQAETNDSQAPIFSPVPNGSESKHAVNVDRPSGPPRVLTGRTDDEGNPITVSCSTCHASRQPDTETKTTDDLNEFHGNLSFAHGDIGCMACHNADDYDSLKLADGRRVEYSEVMTLCAQCHGPQMRDFQHGAHGGMTGFWDTTRGPRFKNNCVDCHHPHVPQFPKMYPTFKPDDRFLDNENH